MTHHRITTRFIATDTTVGSRRIACPFCNWRSSVPRRNALAAASILRGQLGRHIDEAIRREGGDPEASPIRFRLVDVWSRLDSWGGRAYLYTERQELVAGKFLTGEDLYDDEAARERQAARLRGEPVSADVRYLGDL